MFSRLSIPARLLLSTTLYVGLIVTCIYFFTQGVNDNISFATQEHKGNTMLRTYTELLYRVTDYRAAQMGASSSTKPQDIEKLWSELAAYPEDMRAALKLDEASLKKAEKLSLRTDTLQDQWKTISAAPRNDSATQGLYDALITNLKDAIGYIGATSNLILDPDLDSYSVMDALVVPLPITMNRQVEALAFALPFTQSEEVGTKDTMRLAAMASLLKEADTQRVLDDMGLAFKEDANFGGVSDSLQKMVPISEAYGKAQEKFVATLSSIAAGNKVKPETLLASFAQTRAATYALWQASSVELAHLLEVRIEAFEEKKHFVLELNIAGLIAASLFYFFVIHSIISPLSTLRKLMGSIAERNTNFEIPYTTQQNEIGAMGRALSELKKGVEHNLLMQEMTSDYPVIQCNAGGMIEFMNSAAAGLMARLGFAAESLLQRKISAIHPSLEEAAIFVPSSRGLLKTVRVSVGSSWIDFKINALVRNGVCDGVYANVLDVTQEAQSEKAVAMAQENIQKIIDGANRGELDQRLNAEQFQGFYKNMATSINGLMDAIVHPVNRVIDVLSDLSNGDLTRRVEGNFTGAFGRMKDAANRTIDTLTDVVGRMASSADTVATASAEITAGVNDLASRTEKQAATIEETATSMDKISSSSKSNAADSEQARVLSKEATEIAQAGGAKVRETIESIQRIEESSKKIAHIINVIDEIAFQTNLLALNAAVEAARAGEAGKGFAVVAQEVRALAARSADASKEIKDLIKTSVSNVQNGVEIAKDSGEAIDTILEAVSSLASLVSNITLSSQEQSGRLSEVGSSIASMDQALQQNAALVEETNAAAEALRAQAKELHEMITFFKTETANQNTLRQKWAA